MPPFLWPAIFLSGDSMLVSIIFEAEFNGKSQYLVSVDEEFTEVSVVVRSKSEFDLESRLERIEKQLGIIQETMPEESKVKGSPGRIRIGVFGSKGRKD